MLAPFDNTEDYSTASLMKNKGPNLTVEILASLTVEQMVEEILRKAGLLDYKRLVRILKNACYIAKKPFPKETELVHVLITNYCLVSESGNLICKSTLKYDIKNEKRKIALRDYVISIMEKNKSYELERIFEETGAKYDELKEIV